MYKRYKTSIVVCILLVFVTSWLQVKPASASGSVWITNASCDGLTLEGNSTQPIVIGTAFNMADPGGPAIGYVFQQQPGPIGYFTAYLPFGTFDRLGDPVIPARMPSYTTIRVRVMDYLAIEPDSDPSQLGEITLSVVCPDFGGSSFPSGFEQHLSLCFTKIFATPSENKPLGDSVIGSKTIQYANPTSIQGQDGKLWSALYVDKNLTGYVPSHCLHAQKPN